MNCHLSFDVERDDGLDVPHFLVHLASVLQLSMLLKIFGNLAMDMSYIRHLATLEQLQFSRQGWSINEVMTIEGGDQLFCDDIM